MADFLYVINGCRSNQGPALFWYIMAHIIRQCDRMWIHFDHQYQLLASVRLMVESTYNQDDQGDLDVVVCYQPLSIVNGY